MSTLNEIDGHFAECIGYLHASSQIRKGDPVPLQYLLEEAIKSKYGIVKDYTDLVQSCLEPREEEIIPIEVPFEESKASNSDNELELDLLKEDLMCVICNEMDVGARNRLIECSDCHSLYHQECHTPEVTEDNFDNWICLTCKESNITIKESSPNIVTPIMITDAPTIELTTSSKSSSKSSSSHRHSSSSHKSSKSDKHKSSSLSRSSSSSSNSNSSKVTSSSSNSKSSNNSSRSSLSPNNNILSADKRIQIMKKKAATKLQEKRKLPR